MQVTYKPLVESDLVQLLELMTEFSRYEGVPFDADQKAIAIRQLMERPKSGRIWLICDQNGMAIGHTVLIFSYSLEDYGVIAWADEIYLRSDYRSYGIGTQTLEFLTQQAKESDAKLLQLEVRVDNPNAEACYRKFGFEFSNHRIMVNRLVNRLIPPQPQLAQLN